MARRPLWVIVDRELRTLARNRTLLLVAVAFFAVVVGLGGASMGSPGGYVSLTLDLLTPVEVLVPTVAFAVTYQSIRGDAVRGELDVIRTHPVSRTTYVVGVFLGRAAALLVLVFVSLTVAGVLAASGANQPSAYFATHSAGDTPVVYARFVALSGLYLLVVTAISLAVSAAARSRREALALAVGLLILLAVGLDLAVVTLLTADAVTGTALGTVLGFSPASAFRGLVFAAAVEPALATPPPVPTAAVPASVLGLASWLAGALGVAVVAVWRS
ncbi:MAG: ABC transporter permease [Halobacteriaceae archaeon]